MEVLKFWSGDRYWTNQHLGCMGWSVHLCAYCAQSVYHFLGRYSVKCTLPATSDVCKILQHSGELPQCNLCGGLSGGEGSGPKDIWPIATPLPD